MVVVVDVVDAVDVVDVALHPKIRPPGKNSDPMLGIAVSATATELAVRAARESEPPVMSTRYLIVCVALQVPLGLASKMVTPSHFATHSEAALPELETARDSGPLYSAVRKTSDHKPPWLS